VYPSQLADVRYFAIGTKSKRDIPADVINIPEPRSYGLSFDDGPNCSHNAFYQYLRDNNQKATMFYTASNVMNWPYQAQDAVTDGHTICAHGWSHSYMTAMSNEQVFAELYYSRKAIQLVTGVTTKCW
jgi:peptidoglycan/xylan/chitin deacetylase (PgdA/CDA1 family)